MPPLVVTSMKPMPGAPVGVVYGVMNRLAYCCGFVNAVCSLTPVGSTWFLIWTDHRSAPAEKPLSGSTRKPSVHCCDRSGLSPADPLRLLPPLRMLYVPVPERQPTEPGNGHA